VTKTSSLLASKISEDVIVTAARNACSPVDLVLALYPTLAAADVDKE
jgi:hypothetical protein